MTWLLIGLATLAVLLLVRFIIVKLLDTLTGTSRSDAKKLFEGIHQTDLLEIELRCSSCSSFQRMALMKPFHESATLNAEYGVPVGYLTRGPATIDRCPACLELFCEDCHKRHCANCGCDASVIHPLQFGLPVLQRAMELRCNTGDS